MLQGTCKSPVRSPKPKKNRDFPHKSQYDAAQGYCFASIGPRFSPFVVVLLPTKNFNSVRFCLNRFGNAQGLPQAVSGDFH
jgi:hypothetical protein